MARIATVELGSDTFAAECGSIASYIDPIATKTATFASGIDAAAREIVAFVLENPSFPPDSASFPPNSLKLHSHNHFSAL